MKIGGIKEKIIDIQVYFQMWDQRSNPSYPDPIKWDQAKVDKLLSDYKEQLGGTFMQITDIELKIIKIPEGQLRAHVSVMIDNVLFLSGIKLNKVCGKFIVIYPSNEIIHYPTTLDFRSQLKDEIILAYESQLEQQKNRTVSKLLKPMNLENKGKYEKDRGSYFGWCDVEGCENIGTKGGAYWEKTGYWTICHKHSSDYQQNKLQPKMKQEAIERESGRDKMNNKL